MKQWKTTGEYEITRILTGKSSCYLIRKGEDLILVDTGKKKRFERIRMQIGTQKKIGQKIRFLVQTHAHYDHCQNTARFREIENCQVIGSEYEKEYTRSGYTPLPRGTYLLTEIISWLGRTLIWRVFRHAPFPTDIPVRDNYTLPGRLSGIRIISTPGHTAGSLSLIIDDEIAIVGDAMIGIFNHTIYTPFADDTAGMVRSWEKLLDTGCSLFLPGHGREISRNKLRTEYERYVQKLKLK